MKTRIDSSRRIMRPRGPSSTRARARHMNRGTDLLGRQERAQHKSLYSYTSIYPLILAIKPVIMILHRHERDGKLWPRGDFFPTQSNELISQRCLHGRKLSCIIYHYLGGLRIRRCVHLRYSHVPCTPSSASQGGRRHM